MIFNNYGKYGLLVWNIFYFSIYLESHHPNCYSLHDFSEGYVYHQPGMLYLYIIPSLITIYNHYYWYEITTIIGIITTIIGIYYNHYYYIIPV